MKILHIITRLILGGAQENTLLSCEGQHDRGHDVTLITGPAIGPEGSLVQRATSRGYRVIVVDEMRRAIHPMRDWRVYQKLGQLIREIDPDVVHTHSSKAGIVGRWAAHRCGQSRPALVVHTIHGLAFTASTSAFVNGVYKMLERKTAPITDKIVCVADAMREQSLAAGIGTRDQYVTVYSGMETAPFLSPPVPREVVRRELGIRETDIVIGTIARLFHLKGHDDLLEIAPALTRAHPDVKFMWVGDGLLRQSFEARIAQLGLRDRFVLTGLVPPEKIPQLTAAMDILVHPSRREGLAHALPQAALAAKPVVTYDIDGNREALIEGETGFAIPPFDRENLSAALANLIADPQRRTKMGSRGREFALSRFDVKVMIDGLENVYAPQDFGELSRAAARPRHEVTMASFLVIGPHPDDQELGMGGTIARLVQQKHKVHLVDMTNGEPTPHGTIEKRAAESAAAAQVLGVQRTLLGLKNREVTHNIESRHKLAALIRVHRPDALFVPYPLDAHPDHVAVTKIAEDARFDAKLTKSSIPGDPWSPKRIIYYFCTHLRMSFQPSFCIDISDQIDLKMKACACYESQFLTIEGGLSDLVKTMAGYFGGRIATKYAEPFYSHEVLGFSGLDQMVFNGR